jgi:hypothetical protein
MTYLIVGAALLALLFVSIEARLRLARARADRRRRSLLSSRMQRSSARRLRRGGTELHLVRPPGEGARRAHG